MIGKIIYFKQIGRICLAMTLCAILGCWHLGAVVNQPLELREYQSYGAYSLSHPANWQYVNLTNVDTLEVELKNSGASFDKKHLRVWSDAAQRLKYGLTIVFFFNAAETGELLVVEVQQIPASVGFKASKVEEVRKMVAREAIDPGLKLKSSTPIKCKSGMNKILSIREDYTKPDGGTRFLQYCVFKGNKRTFILSGSCERVNEPVLTTAMEIMVASLKDNSSRNDGFWSPPTLMEAFIFMVMAMLIVFILRVVIKELYPKVHSHYERTKRVGWMGYTGLIVMVWGLLVLLSMLSKIV